ncbi:DnaJ domain-containing protein [Nodosilinea sp. LEGE 07088]|uniref:J domain-containing protein n=1 Tax=Nodosilinea sp. LEGE 07088 TaxID=2777968 RepID=UPI0018804C13|nr:J domain-containing protein [Nodosilinea sp. LEGE 07088]MBE9135864.1 DnaJ domain-containing protein [Nodosilinea sp. LEGE 07088]
MKPDQGLFQLGFDDHHAVLGIPITADAKAVRKRYLTIARKLHPDSLSGAAAADAQRASEILSKLVNPAYETLSQEKSSTEHTIVLKLKGQSLRRSDTAPVVTSAAAQELLKAPQAELAYRQSIRALVERQFDQLEAISEVIGELSELNLVYLYRTTDGEATPSRQSAQPAKTPTSSPAAPGDAPPPPPRRSQATIVESYINRAREYETDKDYSHAILELREAVKVYPNSSICHSYLSSLYLKAGQGTMARVHAKRALAIDPADERAGAVQARVNKAGGSPAGKGNTKAKSGDKGGGFFGLFGGKKK